MTTSAYDGPVQATWRLDGFVVMVAFAALLAACTQQSAPPAAATSAPGVPTLAPFDAGHNPGVAGLLANRPRAGQSVEVDGYFAGAGVAPTRDRGTVPPGRVVCPGPGMTNLTDRPYPALLRLLGNASSNSLPEDAPWLIAATPEQARGGTRAWPVLPYHARLRGHLDDPAFASCEHAERIFVVEAVVKVYEQDLPDPSIYRDTPPPGYATWPRHADNASGYSIPYPPEWRVERLDDNMIALRSSQWPGNPVIVRVHAGETRVDPYDRAHVPPLLQGKTGYGPYRQANLPFEQAGVMIQGLDGFRIMHYAVRSASIAVLLNGVGRTYEIALDYPTGLAASPELLADYTALVMGFRLDVLPGPSPTPPVKSALGPGPFITQWQALEHVERPDSGRLSLVHAELVPEAGAHAQATHCGYSIQGHPDGVWILTAYGLFHERLQRLILFVDAVSGERYCGEVGGFEPWPRWSQYETALVQAWLPAVPYGLCEWDLLGQTRSEAYVWAACVPAGSGIESAASGPAVVRITWDGRVGDIESPGDGSLYMAEVQRLFPATVQALIFAHTGIPSAWEASLAARNVQAGPPLIAAQGAVLP